MKIQVRGGNLPEFTSEAQPLYERAPTRDEEGQPLSDFMLLIPGLRDSDRARFTDRVAGIQAVLGGYSEVVFADLNVPLNVLWVSIRPRLGLIAEIVGELQQRIPEAKIVASDYA